MKRVLLDYLACPHCWGPLLPTPLEEEGEEITAGFLTCRECLQLYPILAGVPRLVPDAVVDYYRFFERMRPNIESGVWERNFTPERLAHARRLLSRQKRTQSGFAMEWSFQGEGQATWGYEPRERLEHVVRTSLEMTPEQCRGKVILDAGCGNGILTSMLGEHFDLAIGVDLGTSVVEGHARNRRSNVHFVQGDLMNPPFRNSSIDILISLGVIHHTPNTELTFSCLSPLVRAGGRFYVWLYKPESDWHHRFMLVLRQFFKRLPHGLSAAFFKVTFVPGALLKRRIKNAISSTKEKPQSAQEQLISFMDGLTCAYRFEHTPEEATLWFRKRGFGNIHVPVIEYLGFGIYGDRQA